MQKIIVSLVVLTFLLSSCREAAPPKPADMPDTVACTITVKDKSGRGVPDVLVKLRPTDQGRWAASGLTDAGGTAKFKSIGWYPGVVPGAYAVLLEKSVPVPTGKISENSGEELMDSKSLLAPSYGDVKKTPLSVVVPEGGCTETFEIDMVE